jgi:hypothetical protein
MQKPPPATQRPFATFFIGGAADKNPFWYVGPKTNLILDTLIKRYVLALGQSPLAGLEQNKRLENAYFGYDEGEELLAMAIALHKKDGTMTVRLIGHSLGAWRAAKLSAELAKVGITTSLLITIDPVGNIYFLRFPGNESFTPAPVAKKWINILAQHTISYNRDDAIADAGGRWRPGRDILLKTAPNADYATPYSHAAVWQMMVFPGSDGRSAWQALMAPPQ